MAEYHPDKKTADRVKSCVRAGLADTSRIAKICKITENQLTKHYSYELGYTDDEELAVVSDVAYEMASSGRFPHMTQWWLRQKGPACWQERQPEIGSEVSPLVIVMKSDAKSGQPLDPDVIESD